VKGNELGGGIPWVRPPDECVKEVDLMNQEAEKERVERLSGAKRPAESEAITRQPPAKREQGLTSRFSYKHNTVDPFLIQSCVPSEEEKSKRKRWFFGGFEKSSCDRIKYRIATRFATAFFQ
jgi:hypothetical protein